MLVRFPWHVSVRRVLVLVIVIERGLFVADVELGGAHSRPGHPLRPDGVAIDGEASERAAQAVERQAGVNKRAEDHVARRAGKAVEIEDGHAPIILSRPSLGHARDAVSYVEGRAWRRPASTSEKYRWSARIKWSTTSIPMMWPALTILAVSTRSSGLGVGSPDG